MRKWQYGVGLSGAALCALAACAPSAPKAPPQPTAVERIVASDVEATWNALVSGLPGHDFEINSAAKDERLIRVLVRSATPSQYVDCGEISVRSRHPDFGERNYNFEAANSARYLVADAHADRLVDVERRTSLNALANVRLTPNGSGTLVSVSTQYVMNFKTREFGTGITPRNADSSLNFASQGQASQDEQFRESTRTKKVTVECRPTGEIERRILATIG